MHLFFSANTRAESAVSSIARWMNLPRFLLLAGLLFGAHAHAQTPVSFSFQGDTFQTWTVPETGWYLLDVSGGQGGDASNGSHTGGKGAQIQASVRLKKGEVLRIAVGGQGGKGTSNGNNPSGGGGGGSSSIFRVVDTANPLIPSNQNDEMLLFVAGGGGAASNFNGNSGNATNTSGDIGGSNGSGGGIGSNTQGGAGGAGYLGDGGTHSDGGTLVSYGGQRYVAGNFGGYVTGSIGGAGGWGGGGQGGPAKSGTDGGGGGGGGYSGGGGGKNPGDGGGGGGSFVFTSTANRPAASGVVRTTGAQSGNGAVSITLQRLSFQPDTSAPLSLPGAYFTKDLKFPDDITGGDVDLGPGATVPPGTSYVELTSAANSQSGTMAIKSIPARQKVSRMVVKFQVQTTGGTTVPAEGFSFNFGPDLAANQPIGVDGIASGLAVTFDTYDGGDPDSAPAVEVVYDSRVKGGISFLGSRQAGRLPPYAVVEDASGNSQSLTTGDTWVPVQVDLVGDLEKGGGLINVTWNGYRILKDIPVPYLPFQSEGWRIAFGAQTGSANNQAQRVRNLSIAADTYVTLDVISQFGSSLVTPPGGRRTYHTGESVTFGVPPFVYLDRYRKTLSGTEDDMRLRASYRAKLVGGSIGGQSLSGGSTVKLTESAVVNWQWELDYLAEVNTGTETIQGLSASSVTDSTNQVTLGRNFRPLNYNFDSVVYSQIMGTGTGLDIQFQPKGYVIENAPNSPERFLQLSGGGDHLRASSAGAGLIGGDGSFTIEFWARRDLVTMTADQNVVSLGSSTASGGQLRAGFTAANAFFVGNNGVTVAAPAALTDNSWHHWAAVNDKTANTVTLYRDGKVVFSGNQALNFSGSTQTVTVGARATGGATADGFFPGGINNVRVWKTALAIDQVRSGRATLLVGPGNSSLGLELPFDTLPTADMAGVYIERREGTTRPTSVADTASFPVQTSSIQSGFVLPELTTVPAADSSVHYGWTLRSRFRIDVAGTYTFRVSGGDGAQLFIDGNRIWNPNGKQDDSSDFEQSLHLGAGDHIIVLDAYEVGGEVGRQRPSLKYAPVGTTQQALPPSKLYALAREQLAFGAFTTSSAEGGNVSFATAGFGSVFPETATGTQVAAAVLPGFRFNPLDTTTGTTHNIDPGEKGVMADYRRVFWLWDKKFRFTVDVMAVGLPEAALTAFQNHPFFKKVDGVLDGSAKQTQTAAGIRRVLDLWLAEGERLEVGTLYRTTDRRYTFKKISNAINNFSPITKESLLNATYSGRVAKSYLIPAVSAPGSMTVEVDRTTYRTELAIGEGLDFSSRDAIDTQLTPDLPDDAVLVSVTTNSQPAVTAPEMINDQPGWTGGQGDPWQWDIVGQKWYPLKPGTYTLDWKDRNTGEIYHMEVTAGFPATTSTLAFREDDQGHYRGTAPDYETDVTFDPTDASFPATPTAHYRYIKSPKDPFPVDLDSSATDRWKFLRQAFSTGNSANVDKNNASGPRFTETEANRATVLVFSYRPTTGAATGDLNREQIAVRVVGSLATSTRESDDPSQTVASRIVSADDTAGYGSGYIVNEVSNYNPTLYDRSAAVGEWGPVYPVNWSGLFTEDDKKLSIGYYENPGSDPASTVNPPVGWPYIVTHYNDVVYPEGDSVPAIYIASQLGSEGVGQPSLNPPQPQRVFDPARYTNLTVYNQPERKLPGYNPNEEHALVAPSNLANMTGDQSKNIGQSAFFALQNKINRLPITTTITKGGDTTTTTDYTDSTSEPFVLAQYTDTTTGLPGMTAYRVLTTRGVNTDLTPLSGTEEFPHRDPKTHLPVDEEGNPVSQPANPRYEFKTVVFAGDIVAPFYPMNLISGGRILKQSDGGNKSFDVEVENTDTPEKDKKPITVNQITLWHDKREVPWVVAGDIEGYESKRFPGSFFYRFWYPLAQGFWLGEATADKATAAKATGTPVCWLPAEAADPADPNPDLAYFFSNPDDPDPTKERTAQPIDYSSYWKENYPVLKRGETLAYAGGEYKADHPSAPGLPGVIGWASAEVVFDSESRDGVIYEDDPFNARFMRLLDAYSVDFTKEQMEEAGLKLEETDKVSARGGRWYFKSERLSATLSLRFYYDPLANKLVFRGSVNAKESGDPALTVPPLGIGQTLPNVLTKDDAEALKSLASENKDWEEAIDGLFEKSNPVAYYFDYKNEYLLPGEYAPLGLRRVSGDESKIAFFDKRENPEFPLTTPYRSLKSLGTGTMLVPDADLLLQPAGEEHYVTLVENNDEKVSGAVTLHVVRLGDERYRGAVSVITPKDAFDENVELTHSGDFGGNTEGVYYQWWVRDVAPLDGLPTPDQSSSGWTVYQQGLGLNSIGFTGRPDMILADKLFYVRYGHKDELALVDSQTNVDNGGVLDTAWRLVHPDNTSPDWSPGSSSTNRVPYQWAGAANSPQLQASGSRRFLPQLLMGWVKRVLDAVNPYEARFSADFTGDAPATGSSMIGQAGRPYVGPVALNSSKDAIENVGLIELYETVLQRARDLTNGYPADAGTNQALLLASTRLAMLYEILAGEAYTDAINPSLALTTAGADNTALNFAQLSAANPYVFAFLNEVPSLLQEELSLLRGTDYLKSYPVYNRLFWNYFKGLGEAAYNANYGIGDANRDGLIDETDAGLTYPMGHGDAWGHYLSAGKMHYGLLQQGNYDWQARAELYSLLGNVIPTDYLDEQSFARTAAHKARCGLSIVKATYRDAYVADPAAQWQGYTDSADPARAWGVSEWANRAGQGAVFDWMVGNAILPAGSTDPATGEPLEGLNLINRETAKTDLQALAGTHREIQQAIEAANQGLTPIGVNPDTISFGLDSYYDGNGSWERKTHFTQTYESAVAAAANAKAALDFVSSTSQTMRQIGNDAGALKQKAIEQDIDYRNRLIALLGTPYAGAIGNGKVFAEGYTGPDLVTYLYLDATTVEQIQPAIRNDEKEVDGEGLPSAFTNVRANIFASLANTGSKLEFLPLGMENLDKGRLLTLFDEFYLSTATENTYPKVILNGFTEGIAATDGNTLSVDLPVIATTARYGFKAPSQWGQRAATGEIQNALGDMLRTQVALETAIDDYQVYLNKLSNLAEYANRRLVSLNGAQISRQDYFGVISGLEVSLGVLSLFEKETEELKQELIQITDKGIKIADQNFNLLGGTVPTVPLQLGGIGTQQLVLFPVKTVKKGLEVAIKTLELAKTEAELLKEKDAETYSEFNELLELLKELSNELQEDPSKRLNMAAAVQELNMAGAKVRSLEAEANRLLAERAAMNKMLSARAQTNRYGDMVARLSRDDAARKYESAMETAVRFAWLAAKAYDYETSLSPGNPANAVTVLDDLMRVRQLGQWDGDTPKIGNGGLAEILAKLKANYDFLGGNIGLNNPQWETSTLSLRTEAKRIKADGSSSSNQKWKSYLASAQVADLNADEDFAHYCRPFASPAGPAQPGLKIEFSTEINPGRNFFGNDLAAADHAFSTANFATKLRSVGVVFSGYDVAADGKQKLSATPRVFFVPAGLDIMRYSDGLVPKTRGWNVVTQRLPVPFAINTSNLRDYNFNPAVSTLNGRFAEFTRLGDFRAYPASGGALPGSDPAYTDNQLFSRSVWNTKWILFIPAASLGSDQKASLQRFIDTVTDIQLRLTTFSSYGM